MKRRLCYLGMLGMAFSLCTGTVMASLSEPLFVTAEAAENDSTEKEGAFTSQTSYVITNWNSDEVMEVNEGTIDQWWDWAGITCRWYIEPAGEDTYRIVSRDSGECVETVSEEENASVVLGEVVDGNDAQLWIAALSEDGKTYTFQNKGNGMYLSIEENGTEDGKLVVQTKEIVKSSTWVVAESLYQGEPQIPNEDPTGEKEIQFVRQSLITNRDIELEFDRDVEYAANPETYVVTVNGETIDEIMVVSYFDKMVTLRIPEALEDPEAAKITVALANEYVRDEADNYMDTSMEYEVTYKPYYTKECVSECGVKIKACDLVSDETLQYAADVVDIMVSKRPDVAEALTSVGADIALYPKEQTIFYIPEHREFYDPNSLNVEGYGGTLEIPTTSLAAANIERDRQYALYPDNNVLAHEFGHAFHLIGINLADPELYQEIEDTYYKVREKGLWEDTYTGVNVAEYFGQLSALWFEGLDESSDGTFTGVLSPVNTREELAEYDPDSYELMQKVYPDDQFFPSPWSKDDMKDNFDINGNPRS